MPSMTEFVQTIEKSLERCSNSIATAKDDLQNITENVTHMTAEMKAILDTTKAFRNLSAKSVQNATDHKKSDLRENESKVSTAQRKKGLKQKVVTQKPYSADMELKRKMVLPPIDSKEKPRGTKSSNLDPESEYGANGSKLSQIKKIAQRKKSKDNSLNPETESLNSTMESVNPVTESLNSAMESLSLATEFVEVKCIGAPKNNKTETKKSAVSQPNKPANSYIPVLIKRRLTQPNIQRTKCQNTVTKPHNQNTEPSGHFKSM